MDTRRQFLKAMLGLPGAQQFASREVQWGDVGPRVVRVTVPVPGLDRRLDGMRIGQVSDVHVGFLLPLEQLVQAVELLRREKPDMLAVTGDLVDDPAYAMASFRHLARIPAPYGRFFVMGNHDIYAGRDEVLGAVGRTDGIRALVNEELDVNVQGARFHVSGVDWPAKFSDWDLRSQLRRDYVEQSTQRLGDGHFRLCLVHHPDNWSDIAPRNVELTLSGHTHGGQLAPVGPRVAARMYKYVQGVYAQGASSLYVSGGTGHWFPWRMGVPAEVTVVTLRRA